MTLAFRGWLTTLLALTWGLWPSLSMAQTPMVVHAELMRYTSTPTVSAAKSGNWSDTDTWNGAAVPGNRGRVLIPAGMVVTVDKEIATAYDWVLVGGTLRFKHDVNTSLIVETLVAHGPLEMGTAAQPILPTVTAKIIVRSLKVPIDHKVDPLELTRGVIGMTPVSIYGSPKREISSLAVLPEAGATSLQLDVDPTNWVIGDDVLVAPSLYGQDEVVKVTSITGRTIGIAPALKHTRTNTPPQPKIGPPVTFKVHVGNLTRNAIIQTDPSQAATVRFQTGLQGHVMLMGGGHRIYNAAFVDTGRTNVRAVTDPFLLPDGTREPQLFTQCVDTRDTGGVHIENVRGRYSLHFHNPGPTSPASHVDGVVVRVRRNMGLKIGVQNHSAHVIGRRIVSHQIDGSHLFTEEGDELGEYTDSLAVHSLGSNASAPVNPSGSCMQRNYFEILNRRRRDQGGQGAGVWLQGNLVKLDGSVYSGHDHAGIDHSAQGLDVDGVNNFTVLVRPSLLPEGLWWLLAGRYKGQEINPHEPLLRVGAPVWILQNIQAYAIGGPQENSLKAAIVAKFTTELTRFAPARPKNLIKNLLAWNVRNCVETRYSPWGMLENVTCLAGDTRHWGVWAGTRRIGVSTGTQGTEGNWTYKNVRVDGFDDHKNDFPAGSATRSLEIAPSNSSRFAGVWVDGVPFVSPLEICDDGKDNNANGKIDEGCFPEPAYALDPPPGKDTTLPIVTLTGPTAITLLHSVKVEATDASGIKSVEVELDGQVIATSDEVPFTYEFDLTKLPKPASGTSELVVRVEDGAGNRAETRATIVR